MPKKAETFGSGGPGSMDEQRREWRKPAKSIGTQDWVNQKIEEGDIAGGMSGNQSGTSIFDPVLCELAYRWFCPPEGSVLDPFAGGSVRGIVAAYLGYRYTGVDLRAEQIAANIVQGQTITPDNPPLWIVGDSAKDLPPGPFDFLFSCPPYADLEVYSDNPLDISTMAYADFLTVYRSIIRQAVERLKDDRFACFVVGDVRDKKGFYHNFVSDTIAAFGDAGAMLYNEAILLTQIGSLPIRVGKQFVASRKLGKTHQNVLVFFKGDPKTIRANLGEVEVGGFEEVEDIEPAEPMAGAELMAAGPQRVKISAKSARLPFNGCDPDYIKNVCHARCCESSTAPLGIVVTIHPSEQHEIELLGGRVINGMLQPEPGAKRCPFKTPGNLCGIHTSGSKPFGCIASPFTLNDNDTLIVRNRYRLLKCYNDGRRIPAYIAFRASLDLIFGQKEAARICDHLAAGGGDIWATMPGSSYERLKTNDRLKHEALA
jgi:hypothetical protein